MIDTLRGISEESARLALTKMGGAVESRQLKNRSKTEEYTAQRLTAHDLRQHNKHVQESSQQNAELAARSWQHAQMQTANREPPRPLRAMPNYSSDVSCLVCCASVTPCELLCLGAVSRACPISQPSPFLASSGLTAQESCLELPRGS